MAAASAAAVEEVRGNCLKGFGKGDELGRGEQGIAYGMIRNSTGKNISKTHVLKVSKLPDAPTKAAWIKEARLSKMLGQEGIGPIIHDFWVCGKDGYIVMQRMAHDLRKVANAAGRPLGEKGPTGYNIDHISYCPERILKEYIALLEKMIDMGYLHFDNHPGNLGIVTGADRQPHAILFDFGFTVHRPGMTNDDKMNALGFAIGQMVEHTPIVELHGTYLYNMLLSVAQGTYEWGSRTPGEIDEDEFVAKYQIKDNRSVIKSIVTPAGVMSDLYIGFELYKYFITIPQPTRYDWPDYDHIYTIRRSEPLVLARPTRGKGGARKTRRCFCRRTGTRKCRK